MTTTQRGCGWQHQQRRIALLPHAIGQPCPRCGQPMRHDQRLDLDHTIRLIDNPSSIGDRIVHAVCNRGGDKGAGVPNPEISGVPDPATSAHEKVGPLFL